MKRLFAAAIAAGISASAVGFDNGVASADTALVVGGAKAPGVPWAEYRDRAGTGYYPNVPRVNVDYPGGMVYGRLPAVLWPGSGVDTPSVGESVVTGTNNLDAAIRSTSGPTVVVGLSEGALVLDAEQARLAHDPTAPPPDQLSFTVFSDPSRAHSFLAILPPGTYIPVIDYTVPHPVESQYDTTVVVAEYDGIADFPDRPWNLISVANALIGAATVHTPVAFTRPSDVPPQNITTTTNSMGGTTTTYRVPTEQLPLTQPLRSMGVANEVTDRLDEVLRPAVDAGYSRNDGPSSPATGLDPATQANVDNVLNQIRGLLPGGIG